MRTEPTEEEKTIEPALFKYLRDTHGSVERYKREVNDAPDFAYRVGGILMGFEAVQIPPSSVMRVAFSKVHNRYLDDKAKDGRPSIFSYVWPDEPHSWIAKAISEKEKKFRMYAKNLGSESISLLVHTPVKRSAIFDPDKHEFGMTSLRFGEQNSRHSFNQVLFWHPARAIEVVAPTMTGKISLNYHLMDSYPVRHHTITSTGAFKNDSPEGTVFHDEVVSPHVHLIKPIDPKLRRMKPGLKGSKLRIRTTKTHGNIQIETKKVTED